MSKTLGRCLSVKYWGFIERNVSHANITMNKYVLSTAKYINIYVYKNHQRNVSFMNAFNTFNHGGMTMGFGIAL